MQPHTFLTFALAAHAAADCSCGYTVNKTSEQDYAIFTEMLESDFLHTYDFDDQTAKSMGWLPQNYIQANDTGPYGMAKMLSNIAANPLRRIWDWGGEGIDGGDPGLQLWVKSDLLFNGDMGYVPTAEIVTARDDILYGSFRIAMKTTNENGTCSAFFFYQNDTQEIDVEILSAQQFGWMHQWPVNFVVQNTTSPLALNGSGPQSSNTEYHMVKQPNGEVGAQYREYRFDWLPDRIDYYVDGWRAYSFDENVPSTPGAVHFSHWSNGNPGWTHGPPEEDAVMTVAYVKAYFNTTSPAPIPDQYSSLWPGGPSGNETGFSFFFSRQNDIDRNMTSSGHKGVAGDPIHTPDEGTGVSMFMMRQQAVDTVFAMVGGVVILAILRRLL